MLQDALAHRPTEIDALNGGIVRAGAQRRRADAAARDDRRPDRRPRGRLEGLMRIGDIEITPLSDGELHIPPRRAAQQGPTAGPPGFLDADGLMGVNFGGFLVRTPEQDRGRRHRASAAARSPSCRSARSPSGSRPPASAPRDVDDVIFTHLHFDHVGWSTDGELPFFANAQHHATRSTGTTGAGRDRTPRPARAARTSARSRRRGGSRRSPTRSRCTTASAPRSSPASRCASRPATRPGHCIVDVRSTASARCCSPTPPTTRRSCSATTGRRPPTWTRSSRSARARRAGRRAARQRHADHDDPPRRQPLRPPRDRRTARRWRYAPSIE